MGEKNISCIVVLSIFPSSRGFGFAVFRGTWTVLAYGTRGFKDRKNKNTHCLQKVAELIQMYRPDVVVLENYRGKGSRRSRQPHRRYLALRLDAGAARPGGLDRLGGGRTA